MSPLQDPYKLSINKHLTSSSTTTTNSSQTSSPSIKPYTPASTPTTNSLSTPSKEPLGDLRNPRILCLHGGGSNAAIFQVQCREVIRQLNPYFRFVFADAPFESDPGPDITLVYQDYAPFRRWLRYLPDRHPGMDPEEATELLDESLAKAMREDDAKGATGEWVAVLGFSQGAKMAGSLVLRQQVLKEYHEELREQEVDIDATRQDKKRILPVSNYRFGVIMASRPPLVSFEPDLLMTPMLLNTTEIGDYNIEAAIRKYGPGHKTSHGGTPENPHPHRLRIPTLHVHGRADPGYQLHRILCNEYTEPGTSRVFEWEGAHRIPFRPTTVKELTDLILEMARETGAISR